MNTEIEKIDKEIKQIYDMLVLLKDKCNTESNKRIGTHKDQYELHKNVRERRRIGRRMYRIDKAIKQLVSI